MSNWTNLPPRRGSMLPPLLAGAAFALALFLVLDRLGTFTGAPRTEPREVTPRQALAPMEATFIDIFKQTAPSVAHITTRTLVRSYWGAQTQEGTGSGFVWDDHGTVVTNWHVVKGAQRVSVAIGERALAAQVINISPDHDLAVLRLVGDVHDLRPIRIGTSADLQVGQVAVAIGNPFGFDQSLTTGVISALNRNIRTEEGNALSGLIQVDAAINPGNSGGPLLDSAGRLIGVTTAIYSPSGASAGIGFAIPVDTVNEIVPELLGAVANAERTRANVADLGLLNPTEFISYPLATALPGYSDGAIFTAVRPGSPAARAGLLPFRVDTEGEVLGYGDVLIGIDGARVRQYGDIERALRGRKMGQRVQLTVVRGLPDRPEVKKLDVELRPPG
jgi:S1-C subfamily serine protease